MLQTIKIPRNLMNLTSNLPKPKYFDDSEMEEDITKISSKTKYYSQKTTHKKKNNILEKLRKSRDHKIEIIRKRTKTSSRSRNISNLASNHFNLRTSCNF